MARGLERHEELEQLIDDAWDIARRLDLDLVKVLLEMAKLELYQEIQAAISSDTGVALPTAAIAADH